ncbi:hypothetical protein BGX26_009958 [Mortierella sp. AD094]|nr:hypothetical protein BGX26_009958 [Mortierella sp. AD094]
MSWAQEQAPTSAWSRAAAIPMEEEEGTRVPPLLDQRSRFLLSPVPASMTQGSSKPNATTTALSSSSASTTVTLYPVESVPSHLLCAICTSPYENPVHFLPCCHVFCLECIQLWICMNLGDDLLQNELRRAYPAEGDVIQEDFARFEDMSQMSYHSQPQPLQQQFMFELSRMGDSRSRSGTSTSINSFYESFNHLSPAQQQLLQEQQNQQRIAVLLESREMPKCPMCRTGLHISGWDRIEEHIKVPVSVSPRPRPSTNTATASSPSEWQERRGISHGQRPVSGVERRRTRSDRFTPNGSARGREEAIGEEDEEEEIEMEHVGTLRNRGNSNSSNALSSSSSTYRSRQNSRSERAQQRYLEQPTVQTDRRMLYGGRDENDGDDGDDDEIQSPTTAVIGRRPSEWMQYQQRQIQAQQERQQASRLRANAAATSQYDQDETPHPHALVEERYNEQQEQIRRLYLEQESQEELLRTLTARTASIIEEQEESRRRESNSESPAFTSTAGGETVDNLSRQSNTQSGMPQSQQESPETNNEGNEGGVSRSQLRQSQLQINTSLSRPSNHQSQSNEVPSINSRQTSRESAHSRETDMLQQHHHVEQDRQELSQANPLESTDNEREGSVDCSDDNSIINAIQQGTRVWAQRPSSLELSRNDEESELSISDSVSDSTRSSSGSQSPGLPLSPFNESTISYRTSSTFSQSIQNNSSIRTSFSRRPSIHSQWSLHSLSLQMPTLEADINGFDQEESMRASGNIMPDSHGGCEEQPWADHHVEEEDHVSCCKGLNRDGQGEFSGSTGHEELTVSKDVIQADKPSDGSDDICCGSSAPIKTDSATELASGVTDHNFADSLALGSSSGVDLNSSLLASSSSPWKAGSSISPMIHDLDIHSPIATAEGSMTTIADMQIDADILARARSNSIVFSDEDMPNIQEHPSPIDSPIPTPSTARPRHRFPAGISLNGEEDDQVEDEDDEASHDVQLATELDETTRYVSEEREVYGADRENLLISSSRNDLHRPREEEEEVAQENIPEINPPVVDIARQSLLITTAPIAHQEDPALIIQDPLSTASPNPELESRVHENFEEPEQEPIPSQAATPLVQPQRATLSLPPPLPLPLPVSVEDQEAELTPHPDRPNTTSQAAADESIPVSNERSMPTSGDTRPGSVTGNARYPGTDSSRNESAALLDDFSSENSLNPHEGDMPSTRVREHIQIRTIVRYQPRLPKAHVMSDLISQIRVECPYKEFGCVEIMEMQKALHHGRDKCQFRMVMCPRPRCGLWMRADQIVEHVMMVEPSSVSSSSNSSSVSSPSSSGPPSNSSVRSSRTASLRQRNNVNSRSQQRMLRGQRSLSGNGSPFVKQQHDTIMSTGGAAGASESNSSTPPCAGLTWEREQLARATGIIGQLTEENSSLRQMIRQLTMQNTKLLKDKDRWQRYANLGLGRD